MEHMAGDRVTLISIVGEMFPGSFFTTPRELFKLFIVVSHLNIPYPMTYFVLEMQ